MQTIELFSGNASFSRVALANGCNVATYDLSDHAAKLVDEHTQCDILDRGVAYPNCVGVLWASPPCEGFSVAAIGKNWDKETRQPKSQTALRGLQILNRTVELIAEIRPLFWFIENPRGMMRKVIDPIFRQYQIDFVRHTVTYCQYGFDRMKPTDIWTNCKQWESRPPCKNGMGCHVAAPRGSRTGTQGIRGSRMRAIIPAELFVEIFESLYVE